MKTGDYVMGIIVLSMMILGILIFVFADRADAANITRVFNCTGPDCSRLIAKPNDYLDMSEGTDSKPCIATSGAPATSCVGGACAFDGTDLYFCGGGGVWAPISGGGASTAPYSSLVNFGSMWWAVSVGNASFGSTSTVAGGITSIGNLNQLFSGIAHEVQLMNSTRIYGGLDVVGLFNSDSSIAAPAGNITLSANGPISLSSIAGGGIALDALTANVTKRGGEVEVPYVEPTLILIGRSIDVWGAYVRISSTVAGGLPPGTGSFIYFGIHSNNAQTGFAAVDGQTAEIMNMGDPAAGFFSIPLWDSRTTVPTNFLAASCGSFFDNATGIPVPMCVAGKGCYLGFLDSIQVRFCAGCSGGDGLWIQTGCSEVQDPFAVIPALARGASSPAPLSPEDMAALMTYVPQPTPNPIEIPTFALPELLSNE